MTNSSSWGRQAQAGLLVLVCCALLAGCGGGAGSGTTAETPAKLRVVSSVAPVTDIVRQVAGDRVVLDGVIPEGVDSHTFEPREQAAEALADADVVFLNGLRLEVPVMELARSLGLNEDRVVLLGEAVLKPAGYRYDFSFPKAGGKPNPHLWMNPLHGRAYARVVAAQLCRRDAANCPAYQGNLRAFEARIAELDTAMRAAFATVPGPRRLVTYHDAYAYFAPEYGWEVIGAVQPADFGQPSPAEVDRLIAQIRTFKVRAVFGSEVFPSPVLAQISRAAGARYISELSDDELPGDPGTANHTYLAMLALNYGTITEALGGDPAALRRVPTGGADQ
jgi:ABC-type Zn uptake system ZnuABC Zn-binding protein ZnuA